jgi:hypothetical protein
MCEIEVEVIYKVIGYITSVWNKSWGYIESYVLYKICYVWNRSWGYI